MAPSVGPEICRHVDERPTVVDRIVDVGSQDPGRDRLRHDLVDTGVPGGDDRVGVDLAGDHQDRNFGIGVLRLVAKEGDKARVSLGDQNIDRLAGETLKGILLTCPP
jgi:hypothetical protein